MATYITVDGGTTNTRLYLVQDRRVTDTFKLSAGIKDGLPAFKEGLRTGLLSLLERNHLDQKEVSRILASGMITSEFGLCELPHLVAPVGIRALNRSARQVLLREISEIPWVFIRGVKTNGPTLEGADMIRGEETELMGLVEHIGEEALYILPGSHSKHISVDRDGNITSIKTMLSGELLAAVMQHTILKDATDFEHACLEEDALRRGFEFCRSHGINEALFKTRVLKNTFGATKGTCYSFLLGVILCDEIKAILNYPDGLIVIGGQASFKQAISLLLPLYCRDKRIITLSDALVGDSVALGAVAIYEYADGQASAPSLP